MVRQGQQDRQRWSFALQPFGGFSQAVFQADLWSPTQLILCFLREMVTVLSEQSQPGFGHEAWLALSEQARATFHDGRIRRDDGVRNRGAGGRDIDRTT